MGRTVSQLTSTECLSEGKEVDDNFKKGIQETISQFLSNFGNNWSSLDFASLPTLGPIISLLSKMHTDGMKERLSSIVDGKQGYSPDEIKHHSLL